MTHFSKNWEGPALWPTIKGPIGYLTNEDIETIIRLPNCVGIRVYGLIESAFDDKVLLACAVDEDGNEISKGENGEDLEEAYYLSDIHSGIKIERFNRKMAVSKGTRTARFISEDVVSAFFSLQMLESLTSKEGFSGVGFYNARVPKTINFNGKESEMKFKTYFAASANIVSGEVVTNNFEGSGKTLGVISHWPCPGHCVNFENEDDLTSARSTSHEAVRTDGIYILRWQ